jgi:hypothetical protein
MTILAIFEIMCGTGDIKLARMGGAHNIDFHDFFVSCGNLPLPHMREQQIQRTK